MRCGPLAPGRHASVSTKRWQAAFGGTVVLNSGLQALVQLEKGWRLVFNLGRMIRRLHNLLTWAEKLFGPKQSSCKRSTLVGIYLDRANRPAGRRSGNLAPQERQNGRFAQNRNRPVH